MSLEHLSRSYAADLELRGGDGRTLVGLAAPFNAPAEIFEAGHRFSETIAPGAFARTIQQRSGKVPLFAVHDTTRKLPLGPVRSMVEAVDGLRIEARISKTQAGDEVLELIQDGALVVRVAVTAGGPVAVSWVRRAVDARRERATHGGLRGSRRSDSCGESVGMPEASLRP